MPAALPPIKPKSYPVPAHLDPISPPTSKIPKVLLPMPAVTRRSALPPVDDSTPSYHRRYMTMPPTASRVPAPVTPKMILLNMTEEQLENNMFQHAVQELIIAGYPIPSSIILRMPPQKGIVLQSSDTHTDPDAHFTENLLAMIAIWIQAGHSGGSAPMAVAMMERILSFNTLTPLTNNPDEWYQHGQIDDVTPEMFWQNKRRGEAFSIDPTLQTYYLLEDTTWFGRRVFKHLNRGLRRWINGSHQFWIYKKHNTKPHPLYPIPGSSTGSTPVIKQAAKHTRPS